MIYILAGVKIGGRIVAADYFFDSSYSTHNCKQILINSIPFFYCTHYWLLRG